jgi:hypothetical protein
MLAQLVLGYRLRSPDFRLFRRGYRGSDFTFWTWRNIGLPPPTYRPVFPNWVGAASASDNLVEVAEPAELAQVAADLEVAGETSFT